MRNAILCTILSALAVSAAPATAQETFAPLITENTALFVHVDVRNVELDTVRRSWTNYASNLIERLRFDTTSARATLSALTKDLDKLEEYIRPAYETITEKLGIRELALILDTDYYEGENFAVIIAVPWKNKTEEDKTVLVELLGEEFMEDWEGAFVPKGDFLFIVSEGEEENFADWFEALKPGDGEVMRAMKALGEGVVKAVFSMTDSMREMMLEGLEDQPGMSDEVKNIFLYIARKVDWAAVSFHNPLVAEKQPPYIMTVKTKSATDARQLRRMLESAIDLAITAWQGSWAMMLMFNEDMPEVPAVVYEFSRGYLKTMLPVVAGDVLLFQQPEMEPFVELSVYLYAVPFLYGMFEMTRWEFANRISSCENNLRQIGIALHTYYDAYGSMPPLYTVDAEGKPLHSWRTLILPFMGQHSPYTEIRFDEPWDSEHNKQFHNRIIPQYVCPKNTTEGDKNCHYSVIVSDGGKPITGGSFAPAKSERERAGISFGEITDGTSNTLAVVEVKEAFCWMDPTADVTFEEYLKGVNTEEGRVGSNHRGGANVLLFDAGTRLLPDDIPLEVLRALATPNGGEGVIFGDW